MNFTIFDVETANRHNNTICSISLLEFDGTNIIKEYSTLVNPESTFDDLNINIHHITPLMIKEKPKMNQVWNDISTLFDNNHILIGHNVNFDITVLRKHLHSYNIELGNLLYICTFEMAKQILEFNKYTLDYLCSELNIPLNHHDSMSDAKACFELLNKFNSEYDCELKSFISVSYECEFGEEKSDQTYGVYTDKTILLQKFKSYIEGILADGELNLSEINSLKKYLNELYETENGEFYFDKIFKLVSQIFEDGVIDEEEKNELFNLLSCFINPLSSCCCKEKTIDFKDKLFCLSGNFEHGSKKDIEIMIEDKGGICKSSIVKKTDYLIVGGAGSESWRMGNYGTKVEKAVKMQEQGLDIRIIGENDFAVILKL